jgi:hypothetical protein
MVMENINMEKWEKLRTPPKDALKTIKAGRLKGMTDISPQWRLEVMTSTFGMCGIGWKYEIKKMWLEPAVFEQVAAFAEISLFIKDGDSWSDPIPGIGGSFFIAKEGSGPHASDECFKMAITDALSVAMKQLGVGSDIYRGRWDGSKYRDENKKDDLITNDQLIIMNEEISSRGVDVKKLLAFARVEALDQITQSTYKNIMRIIESKPVISNDNP